MKENVSRCFFWTLYFYAN